MSFDLLILCEITDLLVLHQNDLTGICGNFFHYNTEKGCFSCSVVADKSGFLTLFYMKRGIVQNDFFAKRFTDALA